MSDARRGFPLLSGPPPQSEQLNSEACRKCNKEFNMIFTRSRKCNHCGYMYCHNCSDFQALMPRIGDTGYEATNVCGFCIEYLTITAGGKNYLKSLPLSKLKKYVNAYNIKIDRAVEKDDLIDAIICARGTNGCLPRTNENFYRKYSVPDRTTGNRPRGLFSRVGQSASQQPPTLPSRPSATPPPPEFARPDLAPDSPNPQPQPQYHNAPPHPPTMPRPTPHPSNNTPSPRPYSEPYAQYRPQTQHRNSGHFNPGGYNPYQGNRPPAPPAQNTRPQWSMPSRPPSHAHTHTQQQHQTPRPTPPPSTPPRQRPVTPPPPPLDDLVSMTLEEISALSIPTLKKVLFTNHVNAGQVLEKGDLVKKVITLVEDEKAERLRQRMAMEMEQMADMMDDRECEEGSRESEVHLEANPVNVPQDMVNEGGEEAASTRKANENITMGEDNSNAAKEGHPAAAMASSQSPKPSPGGETDSAAVPKPPLSQKAMAGHLERTGLCVICQDEEANIAIVDCGHLSMCRGCSDLVMKTSRECPLCRTRIVTEARLLRIFKT